MLKTVIGAILASLSGFQTAADREVKPADLSVSAIVESACIESSLDRGQLEDIADREGWRNLRLRSSQGSIWDMSYQVGDYFVVVSKLTADASDQNKASSCTTITRQPAANWRSDLERLAQNHQFRAIPNGLVISDGQSLTWVNQNEFHLNAYHQNSPLTLTVTLAPSITISNF